MIDIDGVKYVRIFNETLYSKYGEPLTRHAEKIYDISGAKNLPDGSNPIYWKDENYVVILSGANEDEVVVGLVKLPDEDSHRIDFARYFDSEEIDDALEVFEDVIEDIRFYQNWNVSKIASTNHLFEV